MNPSDSFAEAVRLAFDNLSLELQRSAEDDNFVEKEFYKFLEFEHEDERLCYFYFRKKLLYSCYS
jgi:hypothetical protein